MTVATHSIEFLDSSGHLSLQWDATDHDSVEHARAEFEALRQAGYSFFRVVPQQVAEFDPSFGSLEVRRVDAAEVEPRLEVTLTPAPPMDAPHKARRGRPSKAQPARYVAARPMRGG